MKPLHKPYKSKMNLTRWVYAVLVFISLYALPGYAGKLPVKQAHATQSEVIISARAVTNKRVAFYNKYTIRPCQKLVQAGLYRRQFQYLSFLHDREATLLLNVVSKKVFPVQHTFVVYVLKTIPQGSDPDSFSLA